MLPFLLPACENRHIHNFCFLLLLLPLIAKLLYFFNNAIFFLLYSTTAFCRPVIKCCQYVPNYLLVLFRFYLQINLVLHHFQLCEMLHSSFSFGLQSSGLYFLQYACIVWWDLFLNRQISGTIWCLPVSVYAHVRVADVQGRRRNSPFMQKG